MDRASAFVAAHGALHRHDILRAPGVVVEEESSVPMSRYIASAAAEMMKRVSVRRKGQGRTLLPLLRWRVPCQATMVSR